MLKKIEVISIPVKDQDKAIEFYVNKIGFKLLVDVPFDEDKRWVQLGISEKNETTIALVDDSEKMSPGHLQGLVLYAEDIEETTKELKDRGVDISPVEKTPWGKFVYFNDVDGNAWAIRED